MHMQVMSPIRAVRPRMLRGTDAMRASACRATPLLRLVQPSLFGSCPNFRTRLSPLYVIFAETGAKRTRVARAFVPRTAFTPGRLTRTRFPQIKTRAPCIYVRSNRGSIGTRIDGDRYAFLSGSVLKFLSSRDFDG